jgi:uncharacterized membrane protein
LPGLEESVETEQQDPEENVSRRQALKRMAAVGGAVWVAPALQTINMATASAGTPRQNCYSVKIEGGNRCEQPTSANGWHCISPVISTGGCTHVTPLSTNSGESWLIDLGSCTLLEGYVKSGGGRNSCCRLSIAPGTSGVIQAPRCATGPHDQLQDISGVELTICCSA